MRMLDCFWKKCKHIYTVQNSYFADSGAEIAARNLQLMRTASIAGTVVYTLYMALTLLFFPTLAISPLYGLIVPVLIVFFLYANHALRSGDIRVAQAQRVTMLLYVVLMIDGLVMSVFPHPDRAAVYYPLFLLMAPVVLILPARLHLMMNGLSLIVFFLLVYGFKSTACWNHDLFEATTASFFSVIVIVFMTQFRIQSDTLKGKYYKLSRQDMLTGVVNKATGMEATQEYLRSLREEECCALLFMDIDSFKHYNDTFGHLEGDRMLRSIGAAITKLCRKEDIVYRFGGDEFIVLLKDIRRPEAAGQRAQEMIEAIAALGNGTAQAPTCSIGICLCEKRCANLEMAIRNADAALYQAKSSGKNRYSVFQSAE